MNASFVQEDALKTVFYISDLIICEAFCIKFSFVNYFVRNGLHLMVG